MRALGVYIFAGGFTLGMRKHFDIDTHFEDGPFGVATAKHNLPGLTVHTDPKTWPAEQFTGIDVVYGNPPCAPWSSAGHWTKDKRAALGLDNVSQRKHHLDPRTMCVLKQFELLDRIRPKIWVWESVANTFSVGRPFVDDLAAQAVAQGYSVDLVLLDVRHTGVAQRRKRFFFVATQVKIDWVRPTNDTLTVRGVIGHLEHDPGPVQRLSPSIEKLLDATPPGAKLHKVWEELNPPGTHQKNDKGGVIGRPGYLHHRLNWDVAPTVFGTHLYRPSQPRRLSVLEQQLLCGYPADFKFVTNDGFNELARAVLPPAGNWMGRNLAAALAIGLPTHGEVRVVDFLR